ncbi:MAG: hypothetical protein CM15mP17_08310 [Gammaproteobacteria bacterium]|nr:MAG: hypothetical protein CM15mP17_08310 [Gammaproteobacteria bacterium]
MVYGYDKAASNINYTSALAGKIEVDSTQLSYNLGSANVELSSPFTIDTVTGNSALDYTFSDVEDYRVLVHGIGPC